MKIDAGTFFILVGTIAAGGLAGYAASSKRMIPALDDAFGRVPDPPSAKPEPAASATVVDAATTVAASASATVDAGPPEPPCDDSAGTPGECPPPGYPTIEGGCGSFAHTRCNELKQSLKPKVAEVAVECLNKQKPQERCDANRVNLCAHLALMNACPEKKRPAECETIIAACGASPIAPSMNECRQTVSGMSPEGRSRLVGCMSAHCLDKGLLGCVAVPVPSSRK
jgi:hypothetical protein